MVARLSGASLGFLAFSVTAGAGLLVGNPVDVTLSRAILALFLFALIGAALGGAAQMVITEHAKKREADIAEVARRGEEASDHPAPAAPRAGGADAGRSPLRGEAAASAAGP